MGVFLSATKSSCALKAAPTGCWRRSFYKMPAASWPMLRAVVIAGLPASSSQFGRLFAPRTKRLSAGSTPSMSATFVRTLAFHPLCHLLSPHLRSPLSSAKRSECGQVDGRRQGALPYDVLPRSHRRAHQELGTRMLLIYDMHMKMNTRSSRT